MDEWPTKGNEHIDANIKCLVSIGTGVQRTYPFGDNLLEVANTLKLIATETESTAELFAREHYNMDEESRYFRFNVMNGLEHIGLEEHQKRDDIAAATRQYVESQAVLKQIEACVDALSERECASTFP
jgi:hypothetical protein